MESYRLSEEAVTTVTTISRKQRRGRGAADEVEADELKYKK